MSHRAEPLSILTIGHSTHPWERFVALLRGAGVTALADVRTAPYSRRFPQFDRDELRGRLDEAGIKYVFLGKELGGRPSNPRFFCDGVADYEKMAAAPEFQQGLERVIEGARKYQVALLCSEHDPLDCHRCLLVARALAGRGVDIGHILPGGETVSQARIEDRLLELAGRNVGDLFAPRDERLALAYRDRARKVAFAEPDARTDGRVVVE
ncbi:MAG: DUF488 family protein [Xanthobacteraceae bacterium]